MSTPCPFPYWIVTEQRQRGREVIVSLAILNLTELNLHPIACSQYSLFLYWKGTLISQPNNHLVYLDFSVHYSAEWDTVKAFALSFGYMLAAD